MTQKIAVPLQRYSLVEVYIDHVSKSAPRIDFGIGYYPSSYEVARDRADLISENGDAVTTLSINGIVGPLKEANDSSGFEYVLEPVFEDIPWTTWAKGYHMLLFEFSWTDGPPDPDYSIAYVGRCNSHVWTPESLLVFSN